MHMADALLSVPTGAVMWGASIGAIFYAVKKIKRNDLSEKKLPLMAVSGAFVFSAQMINFTIPGTGSSGHIGGGILLAGLLGGFPALLTISAVLMIQCLLFADGGLLALGANIFNMGIVPCLIIYPLIFKPILKRGISTKRISFAAFISVVLGLQLGAFFVVLETLCSGITELPFNTFVMLMQPIHLAIGAVEGIVTAAILTFVYKMRPEIIEDSFMEIKTTTSFSVKKTVIVLAALAFITGGIFSLFASQNPDGLEWAIEKTAGTEEIEAKENIHKKLEEIQQNYAVLPDYDFEKGEGDGTSIAGIIGAIITGVFALLTGGIISFIKKRKRQLK